MSTPINKSQLFFVKPTELTGEVMPLEHYLKRSITEGSEPLYKPQEACRPNYEPVISEYGLTTILEFYLQEFVPEMFKRYFESTAAGATRIFLNVLAENGHKIKTLQHFISDCVRAGVKLTWRNNVELL